MSKDETPVRAKKLGPHYGWVASVVICRTNHTWEEMQFEVEGPNRAAGMTLAKREGRKGGGDRKSVAHVIVTKLDLVSCEGQRYAK